MVPFVVRVSSLENALNKHPLTAAAFTLNESRRAALSVLGTPGRLSMCLKCGWVLHGMSLNWGINGFGVDGLARRKKETDKCSQIEGWKEAKAP